MRLVDRRMNADPKTNHGCDGYSSFRNLVPWAFSSFVLQHRAPTSGARQSRTPMAAWREGSAVNSSTRAWTSRYAWTTLARCPHARSRSNDVQLDQFRRSERPQNPQDIGPPGPLDGGPLHSWLEQEFRRMRDGRARVRTCCPRHLLRLRMRTWATGEDPLHFLSSTVPVPDRLRAPAMRWRTWLESPRAIAPGRGANSWGRAWGRASSPHQGVSPRGTVDNYRRSYRSYCYETGCTICGGTLLLISRLRRRRQPCGISQRLSTRSRVWPQGS